MVDINAIRDISTVVAQSVSAAKPQGVGGEGSKTPDEISPASRVTSDEIRVENVDNEVVKKTTSAIEDILSSLDVELQLEVDDATRRIVVKVIDPVTKEVIKQIPSKELLRISKRIEKLLESYSLDNVHTVTIFKDSKDTEVQ